MTVEVAIGDLLFKREHMCCREAFSISIVIGFHVCYFFYKLLFVLVLTEIDKLNITSLSNKSYLNNTGNMEQYIVKVMQKQSTGS